MAEVSQFTLDYRAKVAEEIADRRAARSCHVERWDGGRDRFVPPERWVGATAFAEVQRAFTDEWVIYWATRLPGWPAIERALDFDVPGAPWRNRMEGSWPLMFLVYMNRPFVSQQGFWSEVPESTWRLAGFAAIPSIRTVRDRFRELAARGLGVFPAEGTSTLIQEADRRTGGAVRRDLVWDSTECVTFGRLHHVCPDDECPQKHKRKAAPATPRPGTRFPGRERTPVGRLPISFVRTARHNATDVVDDDEPSSSLHGAVDPVAAWDGPGRLFRLKSTGCLYWCLDADAGLRALRNPDGSRDDLWHGFWQGRLVSPVMGLDVVVRHAPASVPEADVEKGAFEEAIDLMGNKAPRAVVSDSALAFRSSGLHHQRYGTAHVVHARGQGDRHLWLADAHGRWDQHAVPRCKACGNEMVFQALRPDRRGPAPRERAHFRCATPVKPGCEKDQSLYLDEEPRLLTWILRTHELFHQLLHARSHIENAHHRARIRHDLAPQTAREASHRLGIAWQQLRAEGAQLISWLRCFWILGWLDGEQKRRITKREFRCPKVLEKFLEKRRAQGLHLPSAQITRKRAAYEAARIRRPPRRRDEQRE